MLFPDKNPDFIFEKNLEKNLDFILRIIKNLLPLHIQIKHTKNMKKVYIVIFEWLTDDGGSETQVLDVFDNLDSAKKCMRSAIRTEKKLIGWLKNDDTSTIEDELSWSVYPDGRYCEQHENIFIVEKDVNSEYTKKRFVFKQDNEFETVVYAENAGQAEWLYDQGQYTKEQTINKTDYDNEKK